MRKRIVGPAPPDSAPLDRNWLNLEDLVEVELTSEEGAHPIESALGPPGAPGWRAAGPGTQTIRLRFARPQRITCVRVAFEETQLERTQEYVLRWSADQGQTFRDIVRQQWNFSPQGATRQTEDHQVDLPGVTVLELTIVPDIGGGAARASLAELRVA